MEALLQRTKSPKNVVLKEALQNPELLVRELNNRRFYHFLQFMWPEISDETFLPNWHIEYLCGELQKAAENLGSGNNKLHDILINIPPGMTKTITCSIMYPVWCWTRWPWIKFIAVSYSGALSLEGAEMSRDLVRSERFGAVYPWLEIKSDKDTKSNFRVIMKKYANPGHVPRVRWGGNRYSTSVGGTLTGFHGHILIVDDPLNPHQAVSENELNNVNRWLDQTLPTRKVDKQRAFMVMVMQRLHQDDPSGHLLGKMKKNIKHICLPGELGVYEHLVAPVELLQNYSDGLLDPIRLPNAVLTDLEIDLGQYGYAGQIGQNPTPPQGGMFQVDHFTQVERLPEATSLQKVVRYWDKAGTKEKYGKNARKGAYTVGVKMAQLKVGKWVVLDVKRGKWGAEERERIIRATAEADGQAVAVYFEQEPGSGGKESAESTVRNLAGFKAEADLPRGDKVYRADPYSVQVNSGNIMLLKGDWNGAFIEEHRFFPFSTFKDQVDAAGGAFSKLAKRRSVKVW